MSYEIAMLVQNSQSFNKIVRQKVMVFFAK